MQENQFAEFDILYSHFYKKAFLFAKSYVLDELIAEDITSESLIKLWEVIRRDHVKHPDAFLLTILKNKSLDYLKHEAIKQEVFKEMRTLQQEELDLRVSLLEACDPEEIFTTEIQQIIQDTLSQFPGQTRRIFEMSRFENKTNKEIADKMGLSVKSVEYHITKILKSLRIQLADYLPLFYFFFFFK